MNVSLTPALEKFVADKVQSGRYTSASEVVREALRLSEQHEISRETQLKAFNEELDRRIAALDRGEFVDAETIKAELAAKSRERRRRSA